MKINALLLRFIGALAVAAAFLLTGCGDTVGGKTAAEPEVAKFHDRINAGQYEAIYANSDPDFQKAAPKDKVLALFAAIERKLGHFKSASEITWNVRTFNMTTNAVLAYKSAYERGEATETFTFRVSNGKAVLVGYNINSLDMLIN